MYNLHVKNDMEKYSVYYTVFDFIKLNSRCYIVKNTIILLYYIYNIYTAELVIAEQLHVSALYVGHHQVVLQT
jgi:hypothetical protein